MVSVVSLIGTQESLPYSWIFFECLFTTFSNSFILAAAGFGGGHEGLTLLIDPAKQYFDVPRDRQQSIQPPLKTWVLYVLRCNGNTLYCGITNDLSKRIKQHNLGKGARYTRGRGPVALIKKWPAVSMSAALKAERAFKRLSKSAKETKLRSRARNDAISILLRTL